MLQILTAILAGILTVGAPCILPILPIVLGSSVGQKNKTRPLLIVAGFILTFAIIGLIFALGLRVLGLSQEQFRTIAIIFLALFGVFMVWPTPFEKLTSHFSKYATTVNQATNQISGNLGAFAVGASLGLVWTPCAGPILGSILTLIVTSADIPKATILIIAYALGAGIPMLAIIYGGQYITTKVRFIARYSRITQQVFGILILGVALAMYFGYDLVIQARLIEYFPQIVPNL